MRHGDACTATCHCLLVGVMGMLKCRLQQAAIQILLQCVAGKRGVSSSIVDGGFQLETGRNWERQSCKCRSAISRVRGADKDEELQRICGLINNYCKNCDDMPAFVAATRLPGGNPPPGRILAGGQHVL